MSLEDIPQDFADYFGINLLTAEVILSIVVIFAILLPVMYLTKNRNSTPILVVFLFLAEALLVGIGWMPFWILIATIAMMSVSIALLGAKITGG